MDKEQKKKLYKLGLPIIMGTILLLGVSYAWLTLTLNGTKTNVLKAGTLSLTLTDTATNGINIEGAVPMLDEVGMTQSPYTFTLHNNGTVESEYTIYLDDVALSAGETRLPDTVIKYNLVKDGTSITALLSAMGSNPNRVVDSGVIAPSETYTYDLRLWLDENMTNTDMGKVFKGKIRVVAEQMKQKVSTPEECFTVDETGERITGYVCGPTVLDLTSQTMTRANTNAINNITDVVIPEEINGKKITKIGYPHAATGCSLEENDFQQIVMCIGLSSVPLPFAGTSIQSVTIPKGITEVGVASFAVNQLTSVTIPNSVTTLDFGSFYSNPLTSVTIPDSVTSIVNYAFYQNQLTSVTIPKGVTSIEHSAFSENQLTSVIIPSTVTSIGDFAFYNNKLTRVTIPNGVESIGNFAFENNQLFSVTIPNSVMSIGSDAFANNRLEFVTIKGKSSSVDFTSYPSSSPFGWEIGFNDDYIVWNG